MKFFLLFSVEKIFECNKLFKYFSDSKILNFFFIHLCFIISNILAKKHNLNYKYLYTSVLNPGFAIDFIIQRKIALFYRLKNCFRTLQACRHFFSEIKFGIFEYLFLNSIIEPGIKESYTL